MTVGEIINIVFEKFGYPDTAHSRKCCRSRFISYINERLGIETSLNPVHYTQSIIIRNKQIFENDLDHAPTFDTPTIIQNRVALKSKKSQGARAYYSIPDAMDGEAEITYRACFKQVSAEEDDIGLYSEYKDKIIAHIVMREKMYCHERGRLTRRKELPNVVITDDDPGTIPDDGIICKHVDGDSYTLHFKCPCGCGTTETIEAIIRRPDEYGIKGKVYQESDRYGRTYTVFKSMPRAMREKSQFIIDDGKISIQFIGAKDKKCPSDYSVENGIVKWRFMY